MYSEFGFKETNLPLPHPAAKSWCRLVLNYLAGRLKTQLRHQEDKVAKTEKQI